MLVPTLFRRELPSACVPFSSEEGKRLFREALCDKLMETYFPLAEQFHTQAEPEFCGLATLVMIFNALEIDPMRNWKGPWRWYAEEMLDCCQLLDDVKADGICLDRLLTIATCNGCHVDSRKVYSSEKTETTARFKETLKKICGSTDEGFMIVAYDRSVLGQTGTGHFSPVAGYHAASDRVLILDVARFKYGPHWITVPDLMRAMASVDPASNRPRGYAVLQNARREPTHLTLFKVRAPPCSSTHSMVRELKELAEILNTNRWGQLPLSECVELFLEHVGRLLPNVLTLLSASHALVGTRLGEEEWTKGASEALHSLEGMPFFAEVNRIAELKKTDNEWISRMMTIKFGRHMTMLLFFVLPPIMGLEVPEVAELMKELEDANCGLREEVARLQEVLGDLLKHVERQNCSLTCTCQSGGNCCVGGGV